MCRAQEGKKLRRSGKCDRQTIAGPEKVIWRVICRQAEVELAQGKRRRGLPDTGHLRTELLSLAQWVRWLKLEQARRMKDLEENGREKAVAELTLDKQILKEGA